MRGLGVLALFIIAGAMAVIAVVQAKEARFKYFDKGTYILRYDGRSGDVCAITDSQFARKAIEVGGGEICGSETTRS